MGRNRLEGLGKPVDSLRRFAKRLETPWTSVPSVPLDVFAFPAGQGVQHIELVKIG
jgi:hypothetical protein